MDVLTSEELKISEKFADIRYAASQKERENKVLKLQNKEQQLLTEKRKKYLYGKSQEKIKLLEGQKIIG